MRGNFVVILLVNLSIRSENLSPYKKWHNFGKYFYEVINVDDSCYCTVHTVELFNSIPTDAHT